MAASFAVGSLIVLGTVAGLHWLGRTLTAREDRARREIIANRLRHSNLPPPPGPLGPEDEAPCEKAPKRLIICLAWSICDTYT